MIKILSAGTVVELSQTAATDLTGIDTLVFDDISCALTGITTESTEREQIETTALCETYAKTYIDGLKDQDTASSDAFFNPDSVEGAALKDAADSRETRVLQVTFSDGSKWASLVRVQPFGFNVTVGDTVKTTINFKLDGEPVETTA
jgi:hypothetical protein